MGLFNFGFGNTNIDRSLSLKENIQNTILNNITNSSFATKSTATSTQKISINCEPAYNAMLKAYSLNPNWGRPPSITEFAESCSLTNISQVSDIKLNVTSQNIENFSNDLETNIKRDFQQMKDVIKDKDWVSVSAFGKNINESQNIQRIIDNLEKSNIKNIVRETITNANVLQEINLNVGKGDNIKQVTQITLIVSAISNSLLKDVDKTFSDTKISQLDKEVEKDQVSATVGGIFSGFFSTVKTALGTWFGIVIAIIAGFIGIALFAPQVFCFIPIINVMMSSSCRKTEKNYPQPQYAYQQQNYPQYAYSQQNYPQSAYPQQNYPQQNSSISAMGESIIIQHK